MTFSRDPGVPRVGSWQDATVTGIRVETARVKTFELQLPMPSEYMAGQHFLVRLTAPDGYRAQRSYSVATPPSDSGEIDLTVERLADGEVSTFLHDELMVGDTLEVRGPIGGWFVWNGETPAVLVGGGSGIVPLMAMLRLARRTPDQQLARLIVSVRSPDDVIYASELSAPDATIVYTRQAPPGADRPAGRITVGDLARLIRDDDMIYVCGSARFAEGASSLLLDAGVDPARIRIERFGPSG
jgi:ferredoxin-NADP reductase